MAEFRICSTCGYERGFHLYFQEEEGRVRIGLICPNCGQAFDLGWLSREVDPGLAGRKTTVFSASS